MLDQRNWPQGNHARSDYVIIEGEIWAYRQTGDPFEECIYKVLYQ